MIKTLTSTRIISLAGSIPLPLKSYIVVLIFLGALCFSFSPKKTEVFIEPVSLPEAEFAARKLVRYLHDGNHSLVYESRKGQFTVRLTVDTIQLTPGAYSLKPNKGVLEITGGDRAGILYGVHEVIENLENGIGIEEIASKSESPLLPFRAIKFNLPWDSYRRSDALQLHMETCRDIQFWEKFLDMMAENRLNALTLWNLHPFSYMVKLEKYPEALSVPDEEFENWKNFWERLFAMAKERGIETYLVNWNIFVSPEFAAHHGVAEYSIGSTYFGVSDTSELVKDYNRECVREVINQYPDLTGLGFSLGEGMDKMTPLEREQWALDVFIEGMQQADRKVKLIHRAPFSADLGSGGSTDITVEKMTREAIEKIDVPSPIWVEVKFNWSHAHSTPRLVKVHGGPITDTYWNPVPQNYRITWMMRNEDFFCLRWSQTDFIRKHLEMNVHPYVGGYFIGSECYIPATDYFTFPGRANEEYAFERQWMFYKSWGRLLYNPATPDATFEKIMERKYGNGETIFNAINTAGKVPLMIASFWDLQWDYTLYTEGLYSYNPKTNRTEFISVERLMNHPTLDPGLMDVNTFTELITGNNQLPENKTTPPEFADELERFSAEALRLIEDLEVTGDALRYELADIQIWGNIGKYFSEKVRAATALSLFDKTGDEVHKKQAVSHLENALILWEKVVEISSPLYREMPVVHLNRSDDQYFHWSKLVDEVKKDLETARNR